MLETSVSAVPTVAYTMVLRHQVAKPPVRHTSTKLCHSHCCGHRSVVSVCWSVITEVRKTKTNGSTKKSAAITASECTATQLSQAGRRYAGRAGAVTVAISVLLQEAGSASHQQRGEEHAQGEQDECDHAGRPDV